ncbi:MAG: ABC transporter permease, partial [bacterium]
VKPPTPEWGTMLGEGQTYLFSSWYIATFPGIAIFLAVMAFNLLGDGLRDALDPRMKLP